MKNKWLIGGLAAAFLVFIIGAVYMVKNKEPDESLAAKSIVTESTENSSSNDNTVSASSVADSDFDAETNSIDKDNKKKDSSKDKESSDESDTGNGNNNSSGNNGSSSTGNTSKKEGSTKQETFITIPYQCPGSNLVIENISSYDGEFIEDGSDAAVSNVAIAVLRNNGSSCLEFGTVKVVQGSRTLEFEFSTIGAGDCVAVLEKQANSYSEEAFSSATASLAEVNAFEMSTSSVTVEELEGGDLQVTNISGSDIPCVRVFYKFYMADQNAYVGGITYNSKITDLKAGQSVTVSPSHYKDGSSRVVMVKTYDFAD